ncbi:MAG: hypothetical protein JXA25_14185 [Anaerolineales bacterium]|nr:hypothetical protein [Anaerolineales bacterium]
MEPLPEIDKTEQKTFSFAYQDGLWDLAFACMMIGQGLGLLTDHSLFALVILLGPLLMILGKRYITTPRLGYVRFSPDRKRKLRTIRSIAAVVSLLTLVLFISVLTGHPPSRALIAPLLTAGITATLLLVAWFLDFKRLFLYALLIGCAVGLNEFADIQLGGTMYLASGILTLVIATFFFIRFLRRYPVQDINDPFQENHHVVS